MVKSFNTSLGNKDGFASLFSHMLGLQYVDPVVSL